MPIIRVERKKKSMTIYEGLARYVFNYILDMSSIISFVTLNVRAININDFISAYLNVIQSSDHVRPNIIFRPGKFYPAPSVPKCGNTTLILAGLP